MPKKSESHLNPRSPLVLDTLDLPRRPGAMREMRRVTEAPADLGVEMIGVAKGAEISLDLRLESVSEGVLVTGSVTGPITGECGRCLRTINDSLTVTIQELFAYENSVTDETTDEDEFGRVQDDLIDLEPAVRDAVVLALPTNPLCRDDCPGLCSECGVHWDDLPEGHSHELADPRWAALHNLTNTEE